MIKEKVKNKTQSIEINLNENNESAHYLNELSKVSKKGKIKDLKIGHKMQIENSFDYQLNQQYKIFQKDNPENLLDQKVKSELRLSRLWGRLKWVMIPSFLFSLYQVFFSSINFLTVIAFLLFFSSGLFYKIKKMELTKSDKVKSMKELEMISNEMFEESYASTLLLNAYKETYGESKYEEAIFNAGSDINKIKIKFLLNNIN